MRYRSTRSTKGTFSFQKAIFKGLAPDGGLFVPEQLPELSKDQLSILQTSSISEIGSTILSLFIDDIPKTELKQIVKEGISFPLPIQTVGNNRILELFHGPTMAFKDVAAQILSRIMEYYLKQKDKKILILTATSGDTGGAVAHGFSEKDNITVIILFPKNKVSRLQRDQLTHVGKNICPIEIDGTFDDCQKIVKHAFKDSDLQKHNLTSANSINIGRLIPQMIYYAYVWSTLKKNNLAFVIPSGNMGNVTAALYAKMIGIPIGKLVIACNTNDPVVKYYETGRYNKQPSHQTLSTAMDIGHPSNFERILDLLDHNHEKFKELFQAVRIDDNETIKTIQDVFTQDNYLLDPHTAVAWAAADKLKLEMPVIVSTADPVKFSQEMRNATGISFPDKTKSTFDGDMTVYPSKNTYSSVKQIIQAFINH